MKGPSFSRFLPPFASDYSGAASVMQGLGAMTIFIDPGCCAGNYAECDAGHEPASGTVVSAHVSSTDTALGADRQIVAQSIDFIEGATPPLAVLVGTPVSSATGIDLGALAKRIERSSGIPVLALGTTGFAWYDAGVQIACEALMQRFLPCNADGGCGKTDASRPARVNILGASRFDFARMDEELAHLVHQLSEKGFEPIAPHDIASFSDLANADASIALSASGVPLARRLEREFGIPYVVDRPRDATMGELLAHLDCICRPDRAASVAGQVSPDPCALVRRASFSPRAENERPSLLVVAEQVAGCALAAELERGGWPGRTQVATFFDAADVSQATGATVLEDESQLASLIVEGSFQAIVADPLVLRMPEAGRIPHRFPVVHRAISSDLYADDARVRPGYTDDLLAGLLNLA